MTNKFYLSRFFNFQEYTFFVENLSERTKLCRLEKEFEHDIINSSFTWEDTPQGNSFWDNIHGKLNDEDELDIKKNILKLMII